MAISVYHLWNHESFKIPLSGPSMPFLPVVSFFFFYAFQTLVCNFPVSILISISSPTSSSDYHVHNWNRSQYDMFRLSSACLSRKDNIWTPKSECRTVIPSDNSSFLSTIYSLRECKLSLVQHWLKLRHCWVQHYMWNTGNQIV